MRHISDELPLLLTGDVTRDVVIEAAGHLRVCVDCQQELVSAVIAHASLTSAHRFAPEIVAPERDEDAPTPLADPSPLPDMSSLFAEARAESAPPAVTDLGQRRMRRRLVAVAAAAAVVVGGGVTYAAVNGNDSGPVTRTVALDGALGARDAKVQLVDNRMRLDASSLPAIGARQQYEVWLTASDGGRKQSVGFIDEGAKSAEFAVPQRVMSQYNDIAVSIQGIHQTEFSGRVVLRGTYG